MPIKKSVKSAKKPFKVLKKSAAKSANALQRRLHVIYKGRVQGVGFRYTVEGIALELGVMGWVRNLPDGDVELTAEGTEKELNGVLELIRNSVVGKHVRKAVVDWRDATNEFTDFRIEFVY